MPKPTKGDRAFEMYQAVDPYGANREAAVEAGTSPFAFREGDFAGDAAGDAEIREGSLDELNKQLREAQAAIRAAAIMRANARTKVAKAMGEGAEGDVTDVVRDVAAGDVTDVVRTAAGGAPPLIRQEEGPEGESLRARINRIVGN